MDLLEPLETLVQQEPQEALVQLDLQEVLDRLVIRVLQALQGLQEPLLRYLVQQDQQVIQVQ